MAMRPGGRGAPLPYRLLCGVEPCRGGWLVVSAKLQGITLMPQEPEVFPTFTAVLDYRPSFSAIALHIPIGLLAKPSPGGRSCDRAARRLLGWPRSGAITSAPIRLALAETDFAAAAVVNGGLNAASWTMFRRIAEVDAEMQPYWQRTVFEVHPELAFYQLNDDCPLKFKKRSGEGRAERRALLEGKVPGVERVLDARLPGVRPEQLLDASADLWTARRIAARAVARLPQDPEWDDLGLRMEYVR